MPSDTEKPSHAILDAMSGWLLGLIGSGLMVLIPIVAGAMFDVLGKSGIMWLVAVQSAVSLLVIIVIVKRNGRLKADLTALQERVEKTKKPNRVGVRFHKDPSSEIEVEEFGPTIKGAGIKMLQVIAHTPKGVISESDLKEKLAVFPCLSSNIIAPSSRTPTYGKGNGTIWEVRACWSTLLLQKEERLWSIVAQQERLLALNLAFLLMPVR